MVLGRELLCELNGELTHDRCEGVCYLNGEDIGEAMVRQGLARDCPRFSGGRYGEAEVQAATHGATIGRAYALPGYCRPR
jgi:micrococcal nuclease